MGCEGVSIPVAELTFAVHGAIDPLALVGMAAVEVGVRASGWLFGPAVTSKPMEYSKVEVTAIFRPIVKHLPPITIPLIEMPLSGIFGLPVSIDLHSMTMSHLFDGCALFFLQEFDFTVLNDAV